MTKSYITTETYQKLDVHTLRSFGRREWDLMDTEVRTYVLDEQMGHMAMEMQAYVWSQDLETREIPSGRWVSWWDHLRADHFPAWVNRRWPPQTEGTIKVSAKALYPELSNRTVPPGAAILRIARLDNPFADLPR